MQNFVVIMVLHNFQETRKVLVFTLCSLVHIVIRTQAPNTSHHVPADFESGKGITPTSALGLGSLDLTAIFTETTQH